MDSLRKILVTGQWTDGVLLALLGALWWWKAAEVAGREAHLLRRNLGWGYVVDLSIALAFTCALGLFFLLRRIAGRQG
jgi:hypothetical protein